MTMSEPAAPFVCNGLQLDVAALAWGPKAGVRLIRDIAFTLLPGARLVVSGADGSGKTTLLHCLHRGLRPSEGSVKIDGRDIWDISPREMSQRVAFVSSEVVTDFPFSARDVVLTGRMPKRKGAGPWSRRDRDITADVIARLDLQRLAARQFSTLSGGERQRVLIARALVQEPDLLILDEPSDRLDMGHAMAMLGLLKQPGFTVVAAMRDLGLAAEFATEIALIQSGTIERIGSPQQVLPTGGASGIVGREASVRAAAAV